MFGLETGIFFLLCICLFCACAFEFVNGFHDTANAVATVIYTNSLKPNIAVIWSGFCNFLGVFFGGITVAMGIVNLLPVELLIDQNVYHAVAMVLSLLLSAIIWNLGTWYFGLPSSSSHTLIGSILGVGLAYSLLPENVSGVSSVNWDKAKETGFALLLSPLVGFSLVIILMFILKRTVKNDIIFKEPKKNQTPPTWIRSILIMTCTGVSFFHGSNDGQKGVGLIMLILIGITPAYFALDASKDTTHLQTNLVQIQQLVNRIEEPRLATLDQERLRVVKASINDLDSVMKATNGHIPPQLRLESRKDILLISRDLTKIQKDGALTLNRDEAATLSSSLSAMKSYTEYAPTWVILMISLSLGLGTMVGWKRIVVTVGEKIGKQHLTYAQGASAELVAASTIGLSSGLGLPVSTTHVLSSGIAGSMVANKGIKNLQAGTIRNIVLAWVLTLPVSMFLAGTLFIFFRAVL
ncbi:anion permease [Siphonobacter sp. BAB-5385]|uniref:inorganic phosphate transporter n=1 Tax=unclassified Siphonobacter TaxID=2635712 RepID=UPI000B9EC956|nr:inorganic phosphate transporter [Siphonobacter sp. BAB-5385]OZI05300.1 anion permease [Siphonobacter sp. BAB-5385]